jgi:FAD/FMN-containing dehydrogenase
MQITKNKIVYEKDINDFEGKANLIVVPENIDEIGNMVRHSNTDIIPRGAGTSFSGAVIPNNSVIVDMSKMNKIISIDNLKRTVYLEVGVSVSDLNLELERFGLEFPITPLFSGIRTIGGLIATNASGIREIKYGRMRNWVDSLEIVNGKGEIINISRSESEDFIGFEGITGIIARAKLRLTNKKIRTLSIFKSDSIEDLLMLNKHLKLDQDISMLELFSKTTSKLLGLEEKYHLFAEFEGSKGKMKNEEYWKFMKLKEKAYFNIASKGNFLLEDPRIFVDNLLDFFVVLEENNIPYFCNSSSGIVFCGFKPNDKEKKKNILNLVKKLRGRISDSLGFGITKKQFLEKSEIDIIKRVKARHDPFWKFNKNKLVDSSFMNVKEAFGINAENIDKLEDEQVHESLAQIKRVGLRDEQVHESLAQIKRVGLREERDKIENERLKVEEKNAEIIEEKQKTQKAEKNIIKSTITVSFNGPEIKEDGKENTTEENNEKTETQERPNEPKLIEEEREKIKKIAGGALL